MKKKEKKKREKHIAVKLFLCIIYSIIITILFVCSYHIYQVKNIILPWSEVKSTKDYTYIDISKMSEKFAFSKDTNIGIHFVIETEDTGEWHTYLIAINENEYEKYKSIIDYTYERIEKEPDIVRAYGYPTIISEEMKTLALKNIANFIPADNEIEITAENFEDYLTTTYLDTTREKEEKFSVLLSASFLLLFIVIVLLLLTIFDKGKIVENVEDIIGEEKIKKHLQKRKK